MWKLVRHLHRDCTNKAVCYKYLQPGHKKGSPVCAKVMLGDMSGVESDDDNEGEGENGGPGGVNQDED